MFRQSAARATLILLCVQLTLANATYSSEVGWSHDTGQGLADVSGGEEVDLSQTLTWVSVSLIIPSAVGVIIMASSCCLYCYRRIHQTDSFSPAISGDNLHVYDVLHQTKPNDPNMGHGSGPSPMAVWHGTLASCDTTTPSQKGRQSKEGPAPIQYLDLMMEPRSYETIPRNREEVTPYAQVQGEIRPSADKRFSFLPFFKLT